MRGPGKYDHEVGVVRSLTEARFALLLILDGDRGDGFSVQTWDMALMARLPGILRSMADQIEADVEGDGDGD